MSLPAGLKNFPQTEVRATAHSSRGFGCARLRTGMRFSAALRNGVWIAALCLCAQGQNTPGKDAPIKEEKGLPPRATPGDYEAHAQAGTVTVAAEFKGHSVPTLEATYSTEDYVVVETGLFRPAGGAAQAIHR
jgi:hypothetical protein